MKKALLIVVGVAILVAIFFASVREGKGPGVEVDVEKAKLETLSSRVKATGEITPEAKVEISAKVVGEIIALPVKEGDPVSAGQVLVEIEREQYAAAVQRAQAALDQTTVMVRRLELQLADARRQLTRTEDLHRQQIASSTQLEAAQLAVERAEVEVEGQRHAVEQARFTLEQAQDDLRRTTIRSPMDGTVVQLNAEKGETVVPGSTNLPGSVIMTIGDMSQLVAEVEVNEVDITDVELGQPAEVTVDALGEEPLAGHVREIATSGRMDQAQGVIRFAVKVGLDEPDPRLRPGMTAKVDILTATVENAVTVPIQAVQERDVEGDDSDEKVEVVFVAATDTAEARQVETGISDELSVEITSGLEAETPVVVGPYRTLKDLSDGDPIRRADADEGADEPESSGEVQVEID